MSDNMDLDPAIALGMLAQNESYSGEDVPAGNPFYRFTLLRKLPWFEYVWQREPELCFEVVREEYDTGAMRRRFRSHASDQGWGAALAELLDQPATTAV